MGEVPGKPNKLVTVPNISILLRIKEWMELMKAQTGPLPKAGAMYLESQRHILEKFGGVWECKKKKHKALNINDFPPCLGASD